MVFISLIDSHLVFGAAPWTYAADVEDQNTQILQIVASSLVYRGTADVAGGGGSRVGGLNV